MKQEDVYVGIDDADARKDGSCIFAKQVSDPERVILLNGYVISEVGKPPDLVLEVDSRSTGRRDFTVKREGCATLGIGEYWRFDPSGGEYHDVPLAGDTLVDGEYIPIQVVAESDGRHWGYSETLKLELWWEEEELRFRDPVGGEFLLTPEELAADRLAAYERAAEESATCGTAEARVAELEAELREWDATATIYIGHPESGLTLSATCDTLIGVGRESQRAFSPVFAQPGQAPSQP